MKVITCTPKQLTPAQLDYAIVRAIELTTAMRCQAIAR